MISKLLVAIAWSLWAATTGSRMRPRIVGGDTVHIMHFPYQLSLEYMGFPFCGASLIGRNKALTAAHCTEGMDVHYLSVRAGTSFRGKGGVVVPVFKAQNHPNFDNETQDYDVSVLTLALSLRYGPTIRPVRLASYGLPSYRGQQGVVTGWGLLSAHGQSAHQLQAVRVYEMSQAECQKRYKSTGKLITRRMSCYAFPGGAKDACQGDSGGPLVANGVQIGIVSWGIGCAEASHPGVYTKLSAIPTYTDMFAYSLFLL